VVIIGAQKRGTPNKRAIPDAAFIKKVIWYNKKKLSKREKPSRSCARGEREKRLPLERGLLLAHDSQPLAERREKKWELVAESAHTGGREAEDSINEVIRDEHFEQGSRHMVTMGPQQDREQMSATPAEKAIAAEKEAKKKILQSENW